MLKTRSQVRAEFTSKGLSISAWAKENGYSSNMVIAILADNESNPRLKCLRGDAHRIAVHLRLKDGEILPAMHSRMAVA